MSRYFFLIFLIFVDLNIAVSVEEEDFYENGALIGVKDPPYFDYPYDYCERHVLNGPPLTIISSFPQEWIWKNAVRSLSEAHDVCYYQQYPPPYYWVGKKNDGFWRPPYQWQLKFINTFFNRYTPSFKIESPLRYLKYIEYSEYAKKYEYLFYWFDLSYDIIERSLKRELKEKEEKLIQLNDSYYNRSREEDLKRDIEYLKEDISKINHWKDESKGIVNKSFEETTANFLLLYDFCIQSHKHPTAIYERGKILFDRGDTLGFINDIFSLIEVGQPVLPEMWLELGKAYNDTNLYNQAIKALSEAIKKKPELKEAYFERAVAYFETGNTQLALSDYLTYGARPSFIRDKNHKHFAFSIGLGYGCAKGSLDSAIEFFPSLFSTFYGLSKGLWHLASDPINFSKEIVEDVTNCIDYIHKNISIEFLENLVPELKECIQSWDHLTEDKKGYYVGYIIGRYGVDAFICGSSMRAIQLYRNLKKSNAILTFETAIASPENAKALANGSEDFFNLRSQYKKKCNLHVGQQEKHIPGSNNFQEGKGELTISIKRLKEMTEHKLGEGVPIRFSFGETGYKETVVFDEIIGVHVDVKTKTRIPTSVGDIHYDKNGCYHVVPVEPKKAERLLKQVKNNND